MFSPVLLRWSFYWRCFLEFCSSSRNLVTWALEESNNLSFEFSSLRAVIRLWYWAVRDKMSLANFLFSRINFWVSRFFSPKTPLSWETFSLKPSNLILLTLLVNSRKFWFILLCMSGLLKREWSCRAFFCLSDSSNSFNSSSLSWRRFSFSDFSCWIWA